VYVGKHLWRAGFGKLFLSRDCGDAQWRTPCVNTLTTARTSSSSIPINHVDGRSLLPLMRGEIVNRPLLNRKE